jgi:hypothetical protein
LVEGVATIAAAFYPKPVIVRLSDFKSNEYKKLIGGSRYEPDEENPMLGFRGASRYVSADFGEAFALECAAMKRVREDMGLDNVEIMVPFVRTIKQAERVIDMMAKYYRKYFFLEEKSRYRFCAAYALFTWVHDCFEALNFLRARGGSGGATIVVNVDASNSFDDSETSRQRHGEQIAAALTNRLRQYALIGRAA